MIKKLQSRYHTHQIDQQNGGKRDGALSFTVIAGSELFENLHQTEFAQKTEKRIGQSGIAKFIYFLDVLTFGKFLGNSGLVFLAVCQVSLLVIFSEASLIISMPLNYDIHARLPNRLRF